MKAVWKFRAAFFEAGCFWEGRLFQRTCWHFIFPPLFKGFCAYWILVCNVPCIWKPSESFGRLFEKRAVFEREGCSCVTCWYFVFPPLFKGFCVYWILVCSVPCIWKPSEMFRAAFFEAGCFWEGRLFLRNMLVFYFLKWKIEKEWAVSVMAFSVEQYNNTEYSIYYVNRSIVFHDKAKEEAARSWFVWLCYRKWLMLFSLKLQRDNRKMP